MSVIHEALKKIGQTPSVESRKTARPSFERSAFVIRRKTSSGWRALTALAVIALVAAVPYFIGLSGSRSGQAGAPPADRMLGQFQVEERRTIAAAAVPPAPLAAQSLPIGPFELKGIVISEAGSFCLINGVVLKQGDAIGGARVEQISSDTVTLELDGKKVVLSSPGV